MKLTANIVNAHLRDSCEKPDSFKSVMKTEEDTNLKEEAELEEEEECEVDTNESSRHAVVSDLELDELEDSRNEISKVTKRQTTWAVNCFIGWLVSQGLDVDLTAVEKTELNGLLRHFYGSVRNNKGELYGIASYIALRAGLNRYFKEPPVSRPVCLMKDAEFTSANKVFLGVLKRIRKSGRDIASHHQALSPDDIYILRHSRVMDTSTPKGLLNRVWFDIQIHFGRRGKQANRNLKPDSFVIRRDKRGLRFCTLSCGDEATIHHKKDQCSMFEKPGSKFCPLTSLLKYLSRLPPHATALYLQPKKELTDAMWYSHVPLGVNHLGSMLSRMCKEAGTSVIYTNHCIKSTPFHQLRDTGLEGREIASVSVCRSESSPQSHQIPSLGRHKQWTELASPAGLPPDKWTPLTEVSSSTHFRHHYGRLDLNHEELFEDVPSPQTASNQNYVPDAVLPPGEPWLHGGPSRAALSLPSCLCLCKDIVSGVPGSGSSGDEQPGEMKVYAKCHLQQGVMFGPFVGEFCRGKMPSNFKYAWAIRDEAAFVYVDASDENKSNWMRYVTYTSSEEDHNLIVFQFYRRIYYKVTQPIAEGAELRVWIGKDYATLLGLGMGDSVKCEVGDKDVVLRLLQDIQLVTLPEPCSSSLWLDQSQSQSPMPVITDVTTMLNPDATTDSGMICGSAFPSSSLVSLPSPSSHPLEKYDFMPGTDKLLSSPNTPESSPWYFFGFEPDPTGRPLDRNTAVCKLCGDHVSCGGGGGVADLQNHLANKHHIRQRDSNKDRSHLTMGQQRSQLVMVNSGLVSAYPLVLSAHVTSAIANFLIKDLQPLALVEGKGFKQLIHSLLPSHKELPSSCQLESLLKEHHTKGKARMVQLLRGKIRSGGNEETSDYTAPIEFEPRIGGQPLSHQREVPHFVTLSVDVWFHNWQGNTEMYLTLWAHYIDWNFNFQNLALTTQRLIETDVKGCTQAVEAQVQVMAQEWGIFQPNIVLLGGEGRNKMRLGPTRSEKGGEAAGSVPHPNSTTFLEKDDSVSPEESNGPEHSHSSEGLPSVPCFFSAVQGCIDEVMSHPVISKTLDRFQDILSAVFLPLAQNIGLYQHHGQSLEKILTKQEQAELKSWTHSRPPWNKLYPLLSMLIKHKSLFCDMIKEIKGKGLFKEDTCSEFSSSSTSSTSVRTLRSEWKVLEELCLVLKPLDVACRTLAKEAFPRLSLIKPILTGLLSRHLVSRPGDSSSILKEVKRMMRRNLTSCYNNPVVNRVLCVACSLDPQFHGLGFMEEKEQSLTFDWLKKEAVRIVNEDRRRGQGKKQSNNKRSPSPGSPESESDFLRRSKRLKESRPINFSEIEDIDKDIDEDEESDAGEADDSELADSGSQVGLSGMEFLLGDLFSSTPRSRQNTVEESIDMEMSVFRADKGTSLGVEPLQWWRTKAVQFPLLATVARVYLAAPAVAGNAAQDFVQEGAGATYRKRANIPPESLDSILFLHHNHLPTTASVHTAIRIDNKNIVIEKLP